jgi:hypothetical protein
MHVFWAALSHGVCLVLFCGGPQGVCAECHRIFEKDKKSRTKCNTCRKRPRTPSENDAPSSPQLQLALNASKLMTMLPKHSHHRAPLLTILSDNIPSSAAAGLLHSSASYIRDCKRQDPTSSDLLTEKYQRNTKRRRLHPDQLDAVFSFLISACSPVSGTAGPFKQFIKDDDLYQQYLDSRPVGQSSFPHMCKSANFVAFYSFLLHFCHVLQVSKQFLSINSAI